MLAREITSLTHGPDVVNDDAVLRYGPVRLRFVGMEGAHLRVVYPHTLFLEHDEVPDCTIQCRFGEPARFRSAPLFAAKTVWELRHDDEGRQQVYFERREPDGKLRPLMSLTVAPSFDRAELVRRQVDGESSILVGYPVDEYLVARSLARKGGAILHASSVATDAGALLFLGHSGAGKSTMAQLASACGAEVMSDDRTIVTVEHGVATAWGSPWHGSCSKSSPVGAPIAAIFLLVQASRNEFHRLNTSRVFSEMFVRVYQPTIDVSEVERVVDVLHVVAECVPSGELKFLPSEAAFHLAHRAARG